MTNLEFVYKIIDALNHEGGQVGQGLEAPYGMPAEPVALHALADKIEKEIAVAQIGPNKLTERGLRLAVTAHAELMAG